MRYLWQSLPRIRMVAVIMMARMPAFLQTATASLTSARGGPSCRLDNKYHFLLCFSENAHPD
jgi:hypothetical protein